MEKYTIRCTAEQTKRAYKLGAPIEKIGTTSYKGTPTPTNVCYIDTHHGLVIPTSEQLRCWLREKGIQFMFNEQPSFCEYKVATKSYNITGVENTNDYQQAILVAIDAALDYLEKGK